MRRWTWGLAAVVLVTAGCGLQPTRGSHEGPTTSMSSPSRISTSAPSSPPSVPSAPVASTKPTTSSAQTAGRIVAAGPLPVTTSRLELPPPTFWRFDHIEFVTSTGGYAVGSRGSHMAVLYTANSGKTWTARATESKILQLQMVTASIGWMTACAGSHCALKHTINGGRAWTTIQRFPARDHVQIDFASATVGWLERSAPAHNTPKLYRTTDAGKHWFVIDASPPSGGWEFANVLDFINPHDGWLAIGGQGGVGEQDKALYHTTDGGRSWAKIAVSANMGTGQHKALPVGGDLNQIAFVNARVGYMTMDGSTPLILRTTDAGRHWTILHSAAFPSQAAQAYDPTFATPSTGYVLGWGAASVWKTTDGGHHWTAEYPPLHPTWAADFRNGQDGLGFGIAEEGPQPTSLLKTADGGRTWTKLDDSKITFWNLQWTGALTVWGLGYGSHTDVQLHVSHDGGRHFALVTMPVPGKIEGISMTSVEGVVVVGTPSGSEMLTTHDGGKHWAQAKLPFAARVVARSGPQDLWALGLSGQTVYHSTDNGTTWDRQALPKAAYSVTGGTQPRYLRFVTPSFGYMWDASGLLITHNGGKTWHLSTVPSSSSITSVDFVSPDHGWLVDNSNLTLYETINGGRTWVSVP